MVVSTISYVLRERLWVVFLENVAALARAENGRIVDWLVEDLGNDSLYQVSHDIICTSANGLP